MKKTVHTPKKRKINYKKYIVIFYIVFIMAPALIILSLHDTGENLFAKALASIVLLVFFVAFFIYDYRKKLADDWGLSSISVGTDCYNDMAEAIKCSTNIKMTATFDVDDIYNVIVANMPDNGCRYDILLLNPYSEYVQLCGDTEKYAEYAAMFEQLATSSKNEINIKYYSLMPIDNIFIIDDSVFAYSMTQRLADGRRICKHYDGKKTAYRNYISTFKKIWENPIYDDARGGNADEE